jgi:hypothetical protein
LESQAIKVKDTSEVWSENEGKMVFVQGFMKLGEERLLDRELGIVAKVPFLIREAEMYQWIEEVQVSRSPQSAQKALAHLQSQSGIVSVKNFSYKTGWSSKIINSQQFKNKLEGHGQNPLSFGGIVPKLEILANNLKLGPYTFD